MRKQIIYLFFILFYALQNCQSTSVNADIPVLQNKKKVGIINQTADVKCDSCYALRTVKIQDRNFTFRVPVSLNTIDNKKIFQEDYELLVDQSANNLSIKYNSLYDSTSYIFKLKKNKNNTAITRITKISSSVNHHKIAKDDYVDYPATSICEKEANLALLQNREINLNSYFINSEKNCFLCPTKYSVQECLEKKKTNAQFNWQ
ncbi:MULTISPECIES: hypothetical protein [unclassified Chryseobacterium]|uniref:hypothetical protein n=1 Tax=unclassified Chryseobacterium TaxID=2593645 RepID=UPI00100A24DF|nr:MULTISPECIES: hypothetical protein [unclassified Chryseobacterium]RXM50576.1 hypothetical protein BOQ64_17695 [Chryseobacterium sp. CH25]RXM63211.1 hypothetical protein BOQ60_17895 [Chryseobacterium sp. CH1]